jgi:hypothetical protein
MELVQRADLGADDLFYGLAGVGQAAGNPESTAKGEFAELAGIQELIAMLKECHRLGKPLEGADDQIKAQQTQQSLEPRGMVEIVELKGRDPLDRGRGELGKELSFSHPLWKEGSQETSEREDEEEQ